MRNYCYTSTWSFTHAFTSKNNTCGIVSKINEHRLLKLINTRYMTAVFKELLTFLFKKFPLILDKTSWDKSWKSSKFHKWLNFSNSKFSLWPLYINVECGKDFCQEPKTLKTTLIWGEGVFFLLENNFFILSQQLCPRL